MNDAGVGSAFRAVRMRLGWTQEAVAARAHASRPTVSRLERGQLSTMPISTLRAVARRPRHLASSDPATLAWRRPGPTAHRRPHGAPRVGRPRGSAACPTGRWRPRCRTRSTASGASSTSSRGTTRPAACSSSSSRPCWSMSATSSHRWTGGSAWRPGSSGIEAGTHRRSAPGSSSRTRARTAGTSGWPALSSMRPSLVMDGRCARGCELRTAAIHALSFWSDARAVIHRRVATVRGRRPEVRRARTVPADAARPRPPTTHVIV